MSGQFQNLLLSILCIGLQLYSYAQPLARFSASQLSGCSPLTVNFSNTSTGATSFNWSFGNGNVSSLTNPSANFIIPGTYVVTLTARNGTATSSQSVTITVFKNPVANFVLSQSAGCVNDVICFSDTSLAGSAPVTNWSWDFGDGNTSSDQHPCHSYASAGNYTVVLVVTDQNGCTDNKMVTNAVRMSSSFTASFNQTNTQACNPPHSVNFTSTVSPAGSYTYAWDFGNGFTSTQANPIATYNQNGVYTVKATITSPSGCVRVVEKRNLVRIGRPDAAFAPDITSGCEPLSVRFANQTIPDSSNVQYFWQTSAGHNSTLKSPILTFENPGVYNVRLIARYPNGCADTMLANQLIRVFRKPVADFTANKRNFCNFPATVIFQANSSDTAIASYVWNFGDSTLGSGTLDTQVYSAVGSYTVTLTAVSTNGCTQAITKPSFIKIEKPKPTTTISESTGCFPRKVKVKSSDGTVVPVNVFTYFFNDTLRAIDSMGQEIEFTVHEPGEFDLIVLGSNSDGCETIDTFKIESGFKLKPTFLPDKKQQCLRPGIINFSNTTVLPSNIDTNDIVWEWKFGDGSGSGEKNTKHEYKDSGMYVVSLKIIHRGCETDSLITFDTIYILPPIARLIHTSIDCDQDTIFFIDVSAGANQRLWSSSFGNSTSIQYLYIAQVNKLDTIRLIVMDSVTQCRDSTSMVIFIPQKPTLNFIVSNTITCKPYRAIVTDITDYGSFNPIGSVWQVYKDSVLVSTHAGSGMRNDTFIFATEQPGNYSIKLKVTNVLGCTVEKEVENVIKAANLKAAFDIVSTQGCVPFTVTVSNQSVGDFPFRSIRWEWGNGKFDTTTNKVISYTYTQPPLNQLQGFTLRMRITDSLGCTDTVSRRVFPSRPPSNFTLSMHKFCTYDSVSFRWQPMGAGGITPYQYRWSIGDTVVSTLFTFSRKFTDEWSTKKIKLVVTDARQCSDSAERFFVVDNRKPNANFIADPPFIECPGKPINLIDSSVRGATPIVAWNWDFGDNSKSVLRNPSKIYILPNRYTVSLAIRDSAGCVDTLTKYEFVIVNGPIATYQITPKIGCTPHTTFFNLSTKNTKTIEWDMGDGTLKNDSQFAYTYVTPRAYIPFLILSDSNNCRIGFPLKDTIIVHSSPKANFEVSKHVLCTTETVTLTNISVHDRPISTSLWQLGDSSFFEQSVSFPIRFSKGGLYRLGLIVSDSLGCTDSIAINPYFTVYDDLIPPLPPHILRTTVVDDASTLLEWNKMHEPDLKYYTLHYNYNQNQPLSQRIIPDLSDTTFYQTAIQTRLQSYSYQLTATDVCGNVSDTSVKHTTINLTASGILFANKLRWNPYQGWDKLPQRYEVYKLQPISQSYEFYGVVTGAETEYIDSGALCNVVSFYRIKAIYADTSTLYSWSDTSAAVPLYENIIPNPEHIRVTVVDNSKILLQWKRKQHIYPLKTLIFRSHDNNAPQLVAEFSEADTAYVDEAVDVKQFSYTYITKHKDPCGGVSNGSIPSKTILLKAIPTSGNSFPIKGEIRWNTYDFWQDGIRTFTLYHGNESLKPPRQLAKLAPYNLAYTDEIELNRSDDYCYKVIAYANDTTHLYSESNIDCISTKPRLFAPNVFTVNQDGLNETFRLGGYFIETFYIEIYNRLGERIFESNDITNSWDGTFNNIPCASDVYVYIAKATGYNGDKIEIKGNVTLLR